MTDLKYIEHLLPHKGRMVLIEEILRWDPKSILCSTESHRSITNPLRREGILPAIHGIEYGAQSVAIHAALLGKDGERVLGGVRDLKASVSRLDLIQRKIMIVARWEWQSAMGSIASFELREDARILVSGRVIVSCYASE